MHYEPIHLHLHAAFEPSGSMAGHMVCAKALGIRHLWFTEHDVRLGPRQYDIPYFRFDQESLTVEDAPSLCCGFTYLNDTPVDKGQTVCSDGRPGRLLSPDTSGEVGQDGFSGGGIEFFSDAKRH